jgi:CubicO group peptidase (beta-lactamase class C family)
MDRRRFLRAAFLGGGYAAVMARPALAQGAAEPVQGTVARGWEDVRAAFAKGQADDPGGAQLCVYRHGRRVVDLWTGRDLVKDRPFTADSVTNLDSASKGVTTTAAHMLVRRGLLDMNAPVARYWPEFAAAGKADMPVKYLMAHRGGLFMFPPESGIVAFELLDWERCTRTLAGMAPMWPPGTAFRYHPVTFGYLVGELVRRQTGKSVGQFVRDEFRTPLGLRLWLGDLPEAEESSAYAPQFTRLPPAPAGYMLERARAEKIDLENPLVKAVLRGYGGSEDAVIAFLNSRPVHLGEIPAGNMIGNARSLAKLYAATIGQVDGVRLLDDRTIESARTPQTDGLGQPPPLDRLPVSMPLRFGLGYELDRPNVPWVGPKSFGHTGAGGKYACADPDSGVAVAYVCNNRAWVYGDGPDKRWRPWIKAIHETIRRA